jgi:integral membrane protein (TIGR01906 family)
MAIVKSFLITIFIALSVLVVLGLNSPVHQTIFKSFLPADSLSTDRQYLLAYFRGQSVLDSLKFKTNELGHIEDIKEALVHGQSVYLYLVVLFVLWQLIEMKRQKLKRWLIAWQQQLKIASVIWPVIAVIFVLAFEPLFIYFHQVVFPGGNWLFDPATDLIIRLYPPQFFFYFVMAWAVVTEALIGGLYIAMRAICRQYYNPPR